MELKVKEEEDSSLGKHKQGGANEGGVVVVEETLVLEDLFECLSKNKEPFRVVLTNAHLFLHNTQDHSRMERYHLDDLYGCVTLRNKKEVTSSSAFICFYMYPKIKKDGILRGQPKYRKKMTLVFEVNKSGNPFLENLKVAEEWKDSTRKMLSEKFPKSQRKGRAGDNQNNNGSQVSFSDFDKRQYSNDLVDGDLISNSPHQFDHSGKSINPEVSLLTFIRRYIIILNPMSGQGKTMQIFQNKVVPIFRQANIKMEVLVTKYPGHARNIVSSQDLSQVDGIVTIGGDGILYEVVNGLRFRGDFDKIDHIPIGVIAGGSGNGLARSVADYVEESEDYLKNPVRFTTLCAARGKILPVNLAELDLDGNRISSFLSVGWGLLADIDVESEVLRSLGEARFTLWSFYRIANLKKYQATLSYVPFKSDVALDKDAAVDEEVVVEGNFVCVYATYQSYIGSDIIFAPTASPNDGVIHLVYLKGDVSRARAMQFLLSLDKGTHLEVEGVHYVTVKEFTIANQDGIAGNLTIDGEKVLGQKLNVKLSSTPLNILTL